MTSTLKKHEFLLPLAQIFTRGMEDVFGSMPFQSAESIGDEVIPALTSPASWSQESVSLMAEAAHASIPADLRPLEENTVPSWLWRHQHVGSRRAAESDLRDIFTRAVGSATAKAWNLKLFTSEKHARIFFDEMLFALMQRHIGVSPEILAPLGLSWAYGIEDTSRASAAERPSASFVPISNASIDALLGKSKEDSSSKLWRTLFKRSKNESFSVSLRLCDIAADWHSATPKPARAAIDLLALRHNDGSVNVDSLRQTARMLTIFLDLHDRTDVTIGLANLAALLMALGLPYDSDAGRAMAASVAALVTAECTAASAEMASLRGQSYAFAANRDAVMRSLRNHRRAAHGDGNDYEKLSVLPAPLRLKNCPDLTLVSEAQRRWDEVIDLAHVFGLRAIDTTDLTASPVLTVLMTSGSQGLEPMRQLTLTKYGDNGVHQNILHPAVFESLSRMGYGTAAIVGATQHIVGAGSLQKAPGINVTTLKARGFDDVALEKIESYLPCVNSLKLAVTPWIVGIDYCLTQLKIPAERLDSPVFSLLRHVGFSDDEIEAADRYCYGLGTARSAKSIPLRDRLVFACGDEISAEARARMACAVQSFISGDTGANLRLPASQSVACGTEAVLSAWRGGLKSLTLHFDTAITSRPIFKGIRRIKAAARPLAKPIGTMPRKLAKRAPATLLTKKAAGTKRTIRYAK